MENPENLIEVRKLRKSFKNLNVLKGIELDIPRGKTTCIVGTSGSGKSTLMRHMTGLLQADSGMLYFDDKNMTEMSPRELEKVREDIGMVFQYAALLGSMSVFDNIALPLVEMRKRSRALRDSITKEYIRERVLECLEVVRLKGFEENLPSELSGGMRKRVGMARAIVARPKVIFYDEPTSGLDPVISAMIHALIAELQNKYGVTNIVITHDLEKSFEIADRVAMIFDGLIVFCGTVEEFEQCKHPAVRQLLTGELKGPLTDGETGEDAPDIQPSSTQIFKIQAMKELIDAHSRDDKDRILRRTGIIAPVVHSPDSEIMVYDTSTENVDSYGSEISGGIIDDEKDDIHAESAETVNNTEEKNEPSKFIDVTPSDNPNEPRMDTPDDEPSDDDSVSEASDETTDRKTVQ